MPHWWQKPAEAKNTSAFRLENLWNEKEQQDSWKENRNLNSAVKVLTNQFRKNGNGIQENALDRKNSSTLNMLLE